MAIEWYVYDLRGQHGPFGSMELRRHLDGHTDIESVFVWREGFEDWKSAVGVLDFAGGSTAAQDFFSAGNGERKLDPAESPTVERIDPPQVSNRRFANFIALNWRGEFPLWVTYWVFGLIGTLVVAALPLVLAGIPEAKSGFQPAFIFSLVVGAWISIVAISIWQWVAVWRSANKQIARRKLELRKAPWAWIAKVMAVIASAQLGFAILSQGVPQITEVSRIAFLDDPDIPEYSIRVMRNGTEAEITGGIRFGLAADFTKILRASRQIRVVHLNSVGGRIGEGEQLYKVIQDNNLITYVSSQCLSACTMAFAAGRERVLMQGAVLGFHRGSFAGEDFKDSPELDGQRRIFTAAGYDPQFIVRALATPSAEMWTPSESELIGAGVITRISNGSDYAYSGFPPDVSKAYFYNSVANTADVYAAIRDRFPARYDEMVESFYNAVINGKTETETTTQLHDQMTAIIAPLRASAADDVLADIGSFYADQFETLQKQNPAVCYQFARTGTVNSDLPKALIDRELDLEARIVRTASEKFDTDAPSRELWAKLVNRMSARGMPSADIELIGKGDVQDTQQSRYCAAVIVFYREIAALPKPEAARIIRTMIN
jgi:GYF domain 2